MHVQNPLFSGFLTLKLCRASELMTKADEKIDYCVELLCTQGCDRVNSFIAALKAGKQFPEVAGLNTGERHRVLEQLLAVMAVYDRRSGR